MIKNLAKFIERPVSFQKNFLQNCTVYEKISAYYIHVKVTSKTTIKFYKSNNKEIDIVDIILNKMWQTPINDFTKMFLSSESFMEKSVGLTYSFFFFPVSKPINIEYDLENEGGEYRYILDNIRMENGQIINIGYIKDFIEIDTEHLIREKGICLGNLNITLTTKDLKTLIKEKDDSKLQDWIEKWIDSTHICAKGGLENCEGFVLKYKDEVYQLSFTSSTEIQDSNKLALEIFTHNFIEFVSQINFADCLSTNNYVSNVSNIFLKYCYWVQNNPDKNLFTYYHIKESDLRAPTFGWYPGTYFELIPNKTVRELCQNNPLYDNIFKILLNGLQKEKRNNRNALIMTMEDVEVWNSLVKVFSVYNKPLKKFGFKKEKKTN